MLRKKLLQLLHTVKKLTDAGDESQQQFLLTGNRSEYSQLEVAERLFAGRQRAFQLRGSGDLAQRDRLASSLIEKCQAVEAFGRNSIWGDAALGTGSLKRHVAEFRGGDERIGEPKIPGRRVQDNRPNPGRLRKIGWLRRQRVTGRNVSDAGKDRRIKECCRRDRSNVPARVDLSRVNCARGKAPQIGLAGARKRDRRRDQGSVNPKLAD